MDAESVYNVLQRKGVSATVRTYPSAVFDPATNKTTQGDATDYIVKIIPPYRYVKEGFKPTVLITYGKGLTGLANYNLNFDVKVGLKIIINNKEWTAVEISPIQDSTGIILYILKIESGS